MKERKSHIFDREEYDHYVEPEWVSQRLFEEEKFDGLIFDPCCGFGRIVESAKNSGYHLAAGSDIVDRGYPFLWEVADFLKSNAPIPNINIVCNPPFDQFKEFALHALEITTHKVAMIWLVRCLPAARWLQQTPLKRILLLTPRPSMPPGEVIARGEKPGGGKQDFCWLIWEQGFKGTPTIEWLKRDK